VDITKRLDEQQCSPTSAFFLVSERGNFVKSADVSSSSCSSSSSSSAVKSIPILAQGDKLRLKELKMEASAKSHVKDVTIKGRVFRATPKKKFEPVFVVLKSADFFIYRTESDEKPLTILDMNLFSVRIVNRKKFIFELVPRDGGGKGEVGKGDGGLEAFHLEDPASLSNWIKLLNDVAGVRSLSTEENMDIVTPASPVVRPKNIFGGLIGDACTGGSEIPDIIRQTVEWLDQHALTVEGIFRLSGDANKIKVFLGMHVL